MISKKKSRGTEFNLLEELEDYSRILEKVIAREAEHIAMTSLHRAYVEGRIEAIKKATR